MKNNLTKKIILSIALTMIGTATSQSPHSPISMSSEAKAYNISESETNVNELTKYYTQRAWDIKFLGNVKKLISINYLIEISFF